MYLSSGSLFIVELINIFFEILSFLIIARVILSWFRTSVSGSIFQLIIDCTDPILNLAKKITPNIGMLDLSPIIALIGLDLIKWILFQLLS